MQCLSLLFLFTANLYHLWAVTMHMLKREPLRVETTLPFRERMKYLGRAQGRGAGRIR